MSRLARFLRKPVADRRLLVRAAILYFIVAVVIRTVRFARARRVLGRVDALAPRPRDLDVEDVRIAAAVGAVAAFMPDGQCLTEALAAQRLFAQYGRETTLCFGVARTKPVGRPFAAHAWLERDGSCFVGARAIVYDPLRHPGRCGSSPSPR